MGGKIDDSNDYSKTLADALIKKDARDRNYHECVLNPVLENHTHLEIEIDYIILSYYSNRTRIYEFYSSFLKGVPFSIKIKAINIIMQENINQYPFKNRLIKLLEKTSKFRNIIVHNTVESIQIAETGEQIYFITGPGLIFNEPITRSKMKNYLKQCLEINQMLYKIRENEDMIISHSTNLPRKNENEDENDS